MSLPGAARRSATEIGLAYENHCLAYVNHVMHMSLRRVGRAGDGGVDLRGRWWLPSGAKRATPGSEERIGHTRCLRVIGQCKAEKKPLGPRVIRELEGVMAGLKCECQV